MAVRSSHVLLVAAALSLLVATVYAGSYAPVVVSANLFGRNEIPKNNTKVARDAVGDMQGRAKMLLTIHGDGKGAYTWLNFVARVALLQGDMPPIKTHVHAGAKGKNGDLLVNLPCEYKQYKKRNYWRCASSLGKAAGESTPELQAALKAIVAAPNQFYGNIHTKKYPDGAVRGQLKKKGASA
ncbi:hypothetical protein CLOM_g16911 [Closterium sp. NIES-68]|nr:hypothetical protein CLOM_g16911 [Closterium sp. NIES-68]GJP81465.1 hypothetical protein CLOP_g11609 [Closterium sp. NIES-67]